jgi:hypothetical protein
VTAVRHPVIDHLGRHYRYVCYNALPRNITFRQHAAHIPSRRSVTLDSAARREAGIEVVF